MVMSIKNDDDYIKALKRIDELMESYECGRFDTLAEQVELIALAKSVVRYEYERRQIPPPTPEEARKFREEQEARDV